MKIITSLFAAILVTFSAAAQLNGDGYYRLQNYMSKRYAYVTDDKGKLNYTATTADMNAIQLWKGFEKASSDPATVVYLKIVDGNKYDIQAQGTGLYAMLQSHVTIRPASNGTYYAYASSNGLTKYLGDGEKADCDDGVLSGETSGQWRCWYIIPMNTADNYFGVKAETSYGGSYYQPFFASFPYSFASSGMKAFYISKVDNGMAVMTEITGTVPAGTPVLIKASSSEPANNKLNIGGNADAIGGNMLKGAYFNNPSKTHYNRIAYDAKTMRMLGTTSDGSLGYVTASISFIPANASYLSVPEGTPAELKLVTQEEYNKSKEPKSITLQYSKIELKVGETATNVAQILPSTADQTVKWATKDGNIASVSAGDGTKGIITGLNVGTTTVTATTVNGLTAECEVTVTPNIILPTAITLDKDTYTAEEGTEFTLTPTISPADATDKSINWTTSNAAVASVSPEGVVKALQAGTAAITATTSNGLTASCQVTVKPAIVLAASISLDKESFSAVEGTEFTLLATVLPENTTNKTVTWSSSKPAVISVSQDGLVKVLAVGDAVITATTTDGTNLSATCQVTGLSGIEDILPDSANGVVNIYTISGAVVKTAATAADLKALAPGIYVIGNKKVLVK